MQLIGLAGPKKSGKDTIADHLVANHGFVKIGFADKIREELRAAYPGLEAGTFENQVFKDVNDISLALEHCENLGFIDWLRHRRVVEIYAELSESRSPRWLQQQWGDYRRATAGWDYFICDVCERIEASTTPVVVSGLRYAASAPIPTAEAGLIRQLGVGYGTSTDRAIRRRPSTRPKSPCRATRATSPSTMTATSRPCSTWST